MCVLKINEVPDKYVNLIKMSYENFLAKIGRDEKISDYVKLSTGVKQECMTSLNLFVIGMDYAMGNVEDGRTGIT